MEVLDARCSGIDIHKKSITVCVRIREPGARKKGKYAHDDFRDFALSGLVARLGRDSCGDGIHWGLLATDLESLRRAV
jgi:hypothetical protein